MSIIHGQGWRESGKILLWLGEEGEVLPPCPWMENPLPLAWLALALLVGRGVSMGEMEDPLWGWLGGSMGKGRLLAGLVGEERMGGGLLVHV